jgi:LmbE family N-acetylglucosaminyl deacetylase
LINLVIAPHPDDEVLGLGGTISKKISNGEKFGVIYVTSMFSNKEWSKKKIDQRKREIKKVCTLFKFNFVSSLNFPSAQLDQVSRKEIIEKIDIIIKKYKPDTVYIPYANDAHSDHKIVFESASACSKTFRNSFVKKWLCYEVLSETEQGLNNDFAPNYYVSLSKKHINQKILAMQAYKSEMGKFPFPRSKESILSLAKYRGTSINSEFAEAFVIKKFLD